MFEVEYIKAVQQQAVRLVLDVGNLRRVLKLLVGCQHGEEHAGVLLPVGDLQLSECHLGTFLDEDWVEVGCLSGDVCWVVQCC
jgi:hypothetical protein